MQPSRWYLKLGNETIGPITDAELNELAIKGNISPETPVSIDRETWAAIGTISGLATRFLGAVSASVPPATTRGAGSNIVGWAFLLGFILWCVVSTLPGKKQPAPQSSTVVDASSKSQVHTTTAPQSQIAKRTCEYWLQVGGIMSQTSPTKDMAANIAAFRSFAGSIERLPTAGTDPDAVRWALELASVLRECAVTIESQNDPSNQADDVVRGFYAGWSGDFQPLMREWESRSEKSKAVAGHFKAVQQHAVETRALLSSRYGVEFPRLF
jgi:hypothetical protein